MTEEDKNSSPLDEGTESIAYCSNCICNSGSSCWEEQQQEWQQEQPLQVLLELWSGHWYQNKTVWKILISIFSCFVFSGCLLLQIYDKIIFSYLGFANADSYRMKLNLRSLRIYVTRLKKFCSRKITKKKS